MGIDRPHSGTAGSCGGLRSRVFCRQQRCICPREQYQHRMDRNHAAIPEEAAKALIVLQECLGSSLQALYLHGSAVNGGLRPNSDVDLLAVCDRNPAPETSALLVDRLMQISGRHPVAPGMPRCLEVMLFLRQDLAASRYPARCAFIYGEWLRDEFEAGIVPQAIPTLNIHWCSRKPARSNKPCRPHAGASSAVRAARRRATGDCRCLACPYRQPCRR